MKRLPVIAIDAPAVVQTRGGSRKKQTAAEAAVSPGAEGGTRTHTLLRAADFESAASTDSATSARPRSIADCAAVPLAAPCRCCPSVGQGRGMAVGGAFPGRSLYRRYAVATSVSRFPGALRVVPISSIARGAWLQTLGSVSVPRTAMDPHRCDGRCEARASWNAGAHDDSMRYGGCLGDATHVPQKNACVCRSRSLIFRSSQHVGP